MRQKKKKKASQLILLKMVSENAIGSFIKGIHLQFVFDSGVTLDFPKGIFQKVPPRVLSKGPQGDIFRVI